MRSRRVCATVPGLSDQFEDQFESGARSIAPPEGLAGVFSVGVGVLRSLPDGLLLPYGLLLPLSPEVDEEPLLPLPVVDEEPLLLSLGMEEEPLLPLLPGMEEEPLLPLPPGVEEEPLLLLSLGEEDEPLLPLPPGMEDEPLLPLSLGEEDEPLLPLPPGVEEEPLLSPGMDDEPLPYGVLLPEPLLPVELSDAPLLPIPDVEEEPLLPLSLRDFWVRCFFFVSRALCFLLVSDIDLSEVALLPTASLPLDWSPCWRMRSSSARRSTSAALAGSLLMVTPLSEPVSVLCAKLAPARPSAASMVSNLSFFIVISVGNKPKCIRRSSELECKRGETFRLSKLVSVSSTRQ